MLVVIAAGVAFYSVRETNRLFDIGVGDHIRCAVEGNYPKQTQRAEMDAALGNRFAPMLQPLADAAAGTTVVAAHHCAIGGRDDIHVVLKEGGTLVSVVLAPRPAEDAFPRALSGQVVDVGAIRLHEGRRQGYSVAAFQSGGWLGYVISALPQTRNDALARKVAPVLEQFTTF